MKISDFRSLYKEKILLHNLKLHQIPMGGNIVKKINIVFFLEIINHKDMANPSGEWKSEK